MGRKRTLNYRDFRGDFDESEEGRRKKEDDEEGDEEGDEDEEEDEEASDEEGDEEEAAGEEAGEDEDGEPVPVKKKEKKKPAAKAPRAKKPRAGKVIRMRVVWGVFNNSNQRVASFDYTKRQEAQDHAAKLTEEKKGQPFFVQPVKEAIEEPK